MPTTPFAMPSLDVTDPRYMQILTCLTADLRRARLALERGQLTQALAHTLSIEHVAALAGMTDVGALSAGLSHAILEAAGGRPAVLMLAVDRLALALQGYLDDGSTPPAAIEATPAAGQASD
jgi:hypothetical protein